MLNRIRGSEILIGELVDSFFFCPAVMLPHDVRPGNFFEAGIGTSPADKWLPAISLLNTLYKECV
jgi:hypothetical protein